MIATLAAIAAIATGGSLLVGIAIGKALVRLAGFDQPALKRPRLVAVYVRNVVPLDAYRQGLVDCHGEPIVAGRENEVRVLH